MRTSLSLILLAGLSLAAICEKIRLPRIVGMIVAGILLGPFVLDLLDPQILGISAELRKMALIIILIRAGVSLDLSDLKKVGRPVVLMSFVPASFEILGYVLCAPLLLGVSRIEAAVMGAVLGAVSPAVVVPRMLRLMEEKRGTEKRIPHLIMAGASCDDIFVIVLFTTFADMAQGGNARLLDFASIPISILLGVVIGATFGFGLSLLFERAYTRGHLIRNSVKTIIILGAAVDIRYTLSAGIAAVAMIFIALAFRAAGVALCLIGTPLNIRERLFCVIAYLPKATVQAAIGSVPLAMGLSCGSIVLSVAVLGILITAPLGALGIDLSYKKLLSKAG